MQTPCGDESGNKGILRGTLYQGSKVLNHYIIGLAHCDSTGEYSTFVDIDDLLTEFLACHFRNILFSEGNSG